MIDKFYFVGRMVGKALYDDDLLELKLCRPLCKMMVGDYIDFEDFTKLEVDYAQSIDTMKKMEKG